MKGRQKQMGFRNLGVAVRQEVVTMPLRQREGCGSDGTIKTTVDAGNARHVDHMTVGEALTFRRRFLPRTCSLREGGFLMDSALIVDLVLLVN
jgi:hypothetical protein